MEAIIGFLLGVLSSLVIWILTSQILVPKIQFSGHICRYYVDNMKLAGYEFKLCNNGRRNIFDINVYFNINIKGLVYPDLYENYIIPIGTCENKITVLKPSKKGLTMSINAVQLNLLDKKYFPKHIIMKCKNKQLTLDDLYALGTDVYAEITLFGYDSYSGTKKHFCSHKYRLENIMKGEFELDSLLVK
ncbi:MAG: hypothetical protein HXX16_01795 [Bacteroidales bacterium]|nr:hypothetical protein [Bacteroidales bacterium]